jgi:hypothetical protein
MAEKKHESPSFTVTDRRLFTSDGELRAETSEQVETPKPVVSAPVAPSPSPEVAPANPAPQSDTDTIAIEGSDNALRDMPVPPTAAEQEAQAAAYRASSKEVDSQVEISGRSAKEFEINFERFLASLYMTAMMQMGMMHEQGGQPRIDVIGARQTIDTLSLLSEKTKGNLTMAEEGFLQNSLYELRMAYVEVTNALARPPQAGRATGTMGK